MKKKRVISYCITLMLFCQCLIGVAPGAYAISDGQKASIVDHCDEMRENLKSVQKKDRQTRVYLGRLYETILTQFLKPLNMRLLDNNMANPGLSENQSKFADTRVVFNDDYVSYQQALEETILVDCKNEPEKFYNELSVARSRRKKVNQDVMELRKLIADQLLMVLNLKEKL